MERVRVRRLGIAPCTNTQYKEILKKNQVTPVAKPVTPVAKPVTSVAKPVTPVTPTQTQA